MPRSDGREHFPDVRGAFADVRDRCSDVLFSFRYVRKRRKDVRATAPVHSALAQRRSNNAQSGENCAQRRGNIAQREVGRSGPGRTGMVNASDQPSGPGLSLTHIFLASAQRPESSVECRASRATGLSSRGVGRAFFPGNRRVWQSSGRTASASVLQRASWRLRQPLRSMNAASCVAVRSWSTFNPARAGPALVADFRQIPAPRQS